MFSFQKLALMKWIEPTSQGKTSISRRCHHLHTKHHHQPAVRQPPTELGTTEAGTSRPRLCSAVAAITTTTSTATGASTSRRRSRPCRWGRANMVVSRTRPTRARRLHLKPETTENRNLQTLWASVNGRPWSSRSLEHQR